MDKNWESILYIIITVIIIIASALKKKKKLTQNITDNGEQKKPFNFIDVLQSNISEMVGNTEDTSYNEKEIEEIVQKKEPVFIEGEKAIIKEKIKDKLKNNYTVEESEVEFDLKKAIIYSEIINRKQF